MWDGDTGHLLKVSPGKDVLIGRNSDEGSLSFVVMRVDAAEGSRVELEIHNSAGDFPREWDLRFEGVQSLYPCPWGCAIYKGQTFTVKASAPCSVLVHVVGRIWQWESK